ncbi:MAG: type II toxin-antitoxin system HicA family toxin [Acidimicrobiaceae bacterium]|nr:type II toxin-antitoxin system HicA family toxin [Acidimicrobiaceae bacterium]
MKRHELVKRIRVTGSVLVRHGAKHDWYRNPDTGAHQAVPRHNEINDRLARQIIKQLSQPRG